MSSYAREEIMSSSEVVRNFGTVLTSVADHKREKVAIVRNNRLEAVLLAVDVYERMEKTCETLTSVGEGMKLQVNGGNSATLLEFLRKNRLSSTVSISSEEIDRQILEEREGWE